MTILNHIQIEQLITAVTAKPVEFANIMYDFFQKSNLNTEEQQISALMDVIGHFKTYNALSKATLTIKATANAIVNRPKYLDEIRQILANKEYDRSVRAAKILAIILEHSSLAKADRAQELESEPVDQKSKERAEEQKLILATQEFENYVKINNEKLVEEYHNITVNMHAMASLLLNPVKHLPVLDKIKNEHLVLIKQIIEHIKIVDSKPVFDYKNLPVAVEYLISYSTYLTKIELEIQKSINESGYVLKQKKDSKQSLFFADKMLNALSRFLEILSNIKRAIQKFFRRHEDEPQEDRKKLTMYYNSIDPNLDNDIKVIKVATSKLKELPLHPRFPI